MSQVGANQRLKSRRVKSTYIHFESPTKQVLAFFEQDQEKN